MIASDADGGSCGTVLYMNRLRYRAMVACLSSIHSMGICAPAGAGCCCPPCLHRYQCQGLGTNSGPVVPAASRA